MDKTTPDSEKLYEELMRGYGVRAQLRSKRLLEQQRKALSSRGVKLNSIRLSKAEEAECMIEQIDHEISKLTARMERTSRVERRIEFKAAIVHLRAMRD